MWEVALKTNCKSKMKKILVSKWIIIDNASSNNRILDYITITSIFKETSKLAVNGTFRENEELKA